MAKKKPDSISVAFKKVMAALKPLTLVQSQRVISAAAIIVAPKPPKRIKKARRK